MHSGWLDPGGVGELVVWKWGSVRACRYYGVWAARHVKHGVYNWPEHQCCPN